jgi:hypothetical protein
MHASPVETVREIWRFIWFADEWLGRIRRAAAGVPSANRQGADAFAGSRVPALRSFGCPSLLFAGLLPDTTHDIHSHNATPDAFAGSRVPALRSFGCPSLLFAGLLPDTTHDIHSHNATRR